MYYAQENVATTNYLRNWGLGEVRITKEDVDDHFKKVPLIVSWLEEAAYAHDKALVLGENPFPEMAMNLVKILSRESYNLIQRMDEVDREFCFNESGNLIANLYFHFKDAFDGLKYTVNPFNYVAYEDIASLENVELVLFGRQFFGLPQEDSDIDRETCATNDNDDDEDEDVSLSELMGELNNLIGLDTVKNEVNTLINLLRVNKVRAERGMKQVPTSKHLVFSGNPGTGKTTVARILAKIYKALGVLSKGQLVEVDRSKLVAGYVGQTAIQTQEIIQQAMGGILFIDEAYTLSSSKGSNDFGQEAIDTILKAMEDNRDDFVVIVAGYPDLMQEFLDSNPGLRSRFNKFINFDDYSPDELTAIFNVLCEKSGYAIDDAIDGYLHDYFEEKYNNRDRNFANGREVRNFFELAVSNQPNRLASDPDLSDEELITLTIEDVRC